MEHGSTKNLLALVKTNRVSKYTLSAQKSCYSQIYKDLSKRYYPVIISVMPSEK